MNAGTRTTRTSVRSSLTSSRKGWRRLIKRWRGVRRPPTGPLTTSEKSAADRLQQEAPLPDGEQTEPP
jgi:hypothetical protein